MKTQHEKIIATMAKERGRKWFLPQDFMRGTLGELYVGYEASARLSELASQYPEMIESQRAGKYLKRRIRYEDITNWFETIPTSMQNIFKQNGVSISQQSTLL